MDACNGKWAMTARVIHFGLDDCYRVQVLRSAGYEVHESESLAGLAQDLQRDPGVDAVIVSEGTARITEEAAEIARDRGASPVVLFRCSRVHLDEKRNRPRWLQS